MTSILIPVRNREASIGQCIESALAQTDANLEVVVSDNASTDGTWQVCCSYADRDTRVRIFRNHDNLGPVRNWQRCAKEACGEFARFLFSDDLLASDCLEKSVPLLADPAIGMVTSAARIGNRVDYRWRGGRARASVYLWNMMFNGRLPVSPCAAVLRTRDLRRNLTEFGRHGIGPDLLLLLRTARAYPNIFHIAEPLVEFGEPADSLSIQHRASLARGYRSARLRWLAELLAAEAPPTSAIPTDA